MTMQARTLVHPNRPLLWTGRLLLAGCLMLLVLGSIAWLAGKSAGYRLAKQNPAPGLLVDVDGRQMHLNCMGKGGPTVILESGLGAFSVYWAQIQPEVARFSRVCAYDRAGYGWSEPGPYPRTSETIVRELQALLTNAGVAKPFVLVGHSFGGLNMRLYAHRYPDEVLGMVLVDSAHEDQALRLPAYVDAGTKMVRQFRFFALLRELGIVSLFPEKIPNPGLSEQAFAQYQAVLANTGYFETANAEFQAFERSFSEVRQARASKLVDVPFVVLSRGLPAQVPGLSWEENQMAEQTWEELQADLVAILPNSQHMVAERSGHDIPLQQPELVVEAIRQVIHANADGALPNARQMGVPYPGSVGLLERPDGVSDQRSEPAPGLTPSPEANPKATPVQADFTLRTLFESGQMLYVGVGGEIDGVVNPDLVVAPGTVVRAILVIGDGMTHDLYFPDFNAQTAAIGRKEQTSEVTFIVGEEQVGTYAYFCTLPGHRQAGQEGRLVVVPPA